MIVGRMFEGFDDLEIAWRQHDEYEAALNVISTSCNDLAIFAHDLLKVTTEPKWGTITKFDHRSLQGAHDLLAAAWRYEFLNPTPRLPLLPENQDFRSGPADMAWLEWLRGELTSWIKAPLLVRLVQNILTNQNQPLGYAAEAKLAIEILDRFPAVPWLPTLREANLTDLTRYSKELLNDVVQSERTE